MSTKQYLAFGYIVKKRRKIEPAGMSDFKKILISTTIATLLSFISSVCIIYISSRTEQQKLRSERNRDFEKDLINYVSGNIVFINSYMDSIGHDPFNNALRESYLNAGRNHENQNMVAFESLRLQLPYRGSDSLESRFVELEFLNHQLYIKLFDAFERTVGDQNMVNKLNSCAADLRLLHIRSVAFLKSFDKLNNN